MSAVTNTTASQVAANSNSKPAAAPTVDPLANESTFLNLLVAQLKNQDPTSPTDSTQFVSQLTQYSSLEQLIGINSGVKTLNKPATTPTTPTSPAASPAP
jgi:flagellar basal-body rod modification protein FlgD